MTIHLNQPQAYEHFDLWLDQVTDPEQRTKVQRLIKTYERKFPPGSVLRSESDESHSIFLMLEGWGALSKSSPEGQAQIIDFSLPGNFFNLTSADGDTAVFSFDTITDAKVAVIPRDEWGALGKDNPQIAAAIGQEISATNARIGERMLRLGRGTAEERLAYAFLELGIRTGALFKNNRSDFHMPLTQQQIGDFMGLTPVHVCRTLRRMTRNEVLATDDHIDLHLLNVEAIEDLAGISVGRLSREILPVS